MKQETTPTNKPSDEQKATPTEATPTGVVNEDGSSEGVKSEGERDGDVTDRIAEDSFDKTAATSPNKVTEILQLISERCHVIPQDS